MDDSKKNNEIETLKNRAQRCELENLLAKTEQDPLLYDTYSNRINELLTALEGNEIAPTRNIHPENPFANGRFVRSSFINLPNTGGGLLASLQSFVEGSPFMTPNDGSESGLGTISGMSYLDSVPVQLPDEVINKMEVYTYQEESGSAVEKCTICLGRIKNLDKVMKLKCDHTFHEACVRSHFQKSPKCPNCRKDMREI